MDVEKIIRQMTLEDKIALCSGANFWQTKEMARYGIPSLFMCDGPHGLRKQDAAHGADMLGVNESRPSTCFPTAVTLAGSWDTELLAEVGAALGEEAAAMGVGLVLGPGVNIKRDPLCGRNFEYFSEDPCLAGKLAAAHIAGLQKNGVSASLKHFACNNQESCRFTSDSVMDTRTLREMYLPAFETAVKEARPATVMCAYNQLNGVHCSDNQPLLTEILREEWGFEGAVLTDWGAMSDRIEGFRAGCDLNMPGGSDYMEKEVLAAVRSGTLPESAVDASVRRVLTLVLRGQEALYGQSARRAAHSFDEQAHHALAARAAEAGAVLLKNEGVLPLRMEQKIAVIGAMAAHPRYQGSGSSHINPTRLSCVLDALPNALYAAGCDDRGDSTPDLLAQAAQTAQAADAAVVFAGLPDRYESEGFDRDDLQMPEGHIRMIETVARANPNTVVVLLCGCVVECPWAEKVKAVLYMGLPGQAGGEAAADLLYGRANPSGKLAESWPVRYADCATANYYKDHQNAQYREGLYVGYRYYDKANVPVRWPFGFGLSYTSFSFSDLKVDGNTVEATVTNRGSVPGAEVAQLYIAPPQDGVYRPSKELKGFAKVFLQPGESKTVLFKLNDRCFAVWDDGWKIPPGEYTLLVGPSSAELPLGITVKKDGRPLPIPAWQKDSWYEQPHGGPSQQQWEALLGHSYTETAPRKGCFTMDNTVLEMKEHSFVMKCMYKGIEATVAKGFGGKRDYTDPQFRMLMASSAGSPLRSMQISGGIKGGLFKGLLDMANGHYLQGVFKMLKGS